MSSDLIWWKLLEGGVENDRLHLEDEYRSKTGVFGMATQTVTIEQAWDALQSVPSYCEQQAASFAAEPMPYTFDIGNTLRVTGEDYTGQVGELVSIDERYLPTGEIYGVYLDAVDSTVFFRDDELECK